MLRLSAFPGSSGLRKLFPWLLPALLALGCGGGGGSAQPAYSVDVSPSSLSFTATQGGTSPSPKTLQVSYKGDGLVVGYPVGVPDPGWLSVEVASLTTSTATLTVHPLVTYLGPGTYTTTLRVVTGKSDGSQYVYKDIPVSCQVLEGLKSLTASLAFTTDEGAAPAPKTISLSSGQVPYSWTASVEAFQGGPTDWLQLSTTSGTSQTTATTLEVRALARPQGSYSATVVIKDGSAYERARIPVTYQVAGVYSLTGTLFAQVLESARLSDLDVPLNLQTRLDAQTGATRKWQISSNQPWLSFFPSSGDLSASTPIIARLDPAGLWALQNGTYAAQVSITFTGTTATSPTTTTFNLSLSLFPALQVGAYSAFNVGAATTADQLTKNLTVSSNLGPAFAGRDGWHATSSVEWLTATSAGTTGAGPNLTVSAVPTALASLANGDYTARISVQPDDARLQAATSSVDLRMALPTLAHVAPYCTWVNRQEPLILRGAGFSGQATLPVRVGGAIVQGTVISDVEVRVKAPAQSSTGSVALSMDNALGLDRGSKSLTVLPGPAYGAATVPFSDYLRRLVLDPGRMSVLTVGTDKIVRFRWDGSSWNTDTYPLPNAAGVGVAADGASLLMSAGGFYTSTLFLEVDPSTFATRKSSSYASVYNIFGLIAGLNDGRTLVIDQDQWAESVWYPALQQGPYVDAWGASMLLTRDRNRLVVHSNGSISSTVSLDVNDGSFIARSIPVDYAGKASGISQDGSRFVASSTVYDKAFSYLGAIVLPERYIDTLAVSPDGAWAYLLAMDSSNAWVLREVDISAASGPYTASSTPLAFTLPATQVPMAMMVSEDGSTLFLLTQDPAAPSATSRLHAIPLGR